MKTTRPDEDSARILVFAPIGRDGAASAELLRQAGLMADVCGGLEDLVANLAPSAAAVFLAEEGLFGKDISDLAAWVERQPPWSDLPFIVLTSRHDHPVMGAWRQRLVATLCNVSLLERPLQPITLTSTMQAAVRARRRQYELRALLEAREQVAQQLEALVAIRTRELEDTNQALRKEMAERALVEEALRQTQRLEAIGQLTGGIAHDFNNLLTVILGGLEVLDRHADPRRRKRLMDGMRQAAQRGADLTGQLLTFSRRQSLRPKPINLPLQVGRMRELLDRSLGPDIDVRLDLAAGLWAIEVDPGEFELAVLNLAVNARDATTGKGTITIHAENARTSGSGAPPGEVVRLSIIDTGIGMTPKVQSRVFEPFFTTKEVGKGSGLGLAQVYGFAQQANGRVEVDSAVGRGTRVTLILPRSRKAPADDPLAVTDLPDAQQPSASGKCVLLVEDDNEVAALVSGMLAELGYDVVRTANAAAALGALANGRPIDVVLAEFMMPGGMNGVELAQEIRFRRAGLPILLTSGFVRAAQQGAEAAGIRLLAKPYRLADLAEALASVFARA